MNIKKIFPYLLLSLSLIGLLASSILMNDTVKLATNPNVELPCNINPFISCKSVASTWQSHVFGFPNPILGIISFSLLFGLALALIYHVIPYENNSGGTPFNPLKKKYFWTLVNYGIFASVLFAVWFAYESIFVIGSLCIYCMTVWAAVWPIFIYTTLWNIEENHFSLKKINHHCDEFLKKHHFFLLVAWYIIIATLIFFRFKDFFLY